ncbi:MAG: hypothetical protein ACI92E_001281 [Oceanicoccus sp.]
MVLISAANQERVYRKLLNTYIAKNRKVKSIEPMNNQQLLSSIEDRLKAIYVDYASGKDVPPAMLFRTEGFMEAACFSGLVNEEEVRSLMVVTQKAVFGHALSNAQEVGLAIHSSMKRAPVYPSTK